jgi:hypothetical protein
LLGAVDALALGKSLESPLVRRQRHRSVRADGGCRDSRPVTRDVRIRIDPTGLTRRVRSDPDLQCRASVLHLSSCGGSPAYFHRPSADPSRFPPESTRNANARDQARARSRRARTPPILTADVVTGFALRTITPLVSEGSANGETRRMKLNVRLLAIDQDAVLPMLVHEVAILLSWKLHQTPGHGQPWKPLLERLCYKPLRCHSFDVSNLKLNALLPPSHDRGRRTQLPST